MPPTQTIRIRGISFECPAPYSPGHVCNAAEARVLNGAFAENVRNNFSKREEIALNSVVSDKDIEQLQEKFAEYAASYILGGTRGNLADPLAREARRIARIVALAELNRAGIAEEDADKERLSARITDLAKSEDVRTEAQRRLDALAAVSEEILGADI